MFRFILAHVIRNTQESIASLGQNYTREENLLNEQASQLKTEAEKLDDEIRKLRTGDRETSYEAESPNAARLRRILRAELGLAADEVVYLCDVLQIPNPEWQNAVEGLLGFNRFTLLVPPTTTPPCKSIANTKTPFTGNPPRHRIHPPTKNGTYHPEAERSGRTTQHGDTYTGKHVYK